MFAGKTSELLWRVSHHADAQIFKHTSDSRYGTESECVSHNGQRRPCWVASTADQIREQIKPQTTLVGIDEAQFFGPDIVGLVEELANCGISVLLAGLDQDYTGKTFGSMGELLGCADAVVKLAAECSQCGKSATKTFRKAASRETVLVGADDAYEARCRTCWAS